MWYDPFEEMRRFKKEFERTFENLLKMPRMPEFRAPLADINESEDKLYINVEIPGVNKKDIQLKVGERFIEIKANKKVEKKIAKKGFYHEERSFKGFYRRLPLPCEVIPEKAKAKYEDGILKIEIPKKEKKKEKYKEIEIK